MIALTKRQIEVLDKIKDGCSNKQASEALGMSVKTLENHVRSIFLRLQVKNRTQAVLKGIREGIIHD